MYILFWKAGDRPKRWLYDNHENQNLLGMTDRETGKGGRSLLNGWSFGQLDPPVLVLVSGSVLYLYLEEGELFVFMSVLDCEWGPGIYACL